MNDDTKKQRVTFGLVFLMEGTALLFDAVSIIPFANIVVVPAAAFTFWLWFKIHGIDIGFTSPKRLLTMSTGSLIEIIPVISALPGWTAAVGITLGLVYFEDKTGLKIPGAGTAKVGGRSVMQKTQKRLAYDSEKRRAVVERYQRMYESKRAASSEGRPAPLQDIRPREDLTQAA